MATADARDAPDLSDAEAGRLWHGSDSDSQEEEEDLETRSLESLELGYGSDTPEVDLTPLRVPYQKKPRDMSFENFCFFHQRQIAINGAQEEAGQHPRAIDDGLPPNRLNDSLRESGRRVALIEALRVALNEHKATHHPAPPKGFNKQERADWHWSCHQQDVIEDVFGKRLASVEQVYRNMCCGAVPKLPYTGRPSEINTVCSWRPLTMFQLQILNSAGAFNPERLYKIEGWSFRFEKETR